MSYDCIIIKDWEYSEQVDLEPLRSFLAGLPHMTPAPNDERSFSYSNGKIVVQFALDLVDKEGNTLFMDWETLKPVHPEKVPRKVNSISVAGPFGDALALWDTCFPITWHLKWQLFDHQVGEFIEQI